MLKPMKRHTPLIAVTLAGLMAFMPLQALASVSSEEGPRPSVVQPVADVDLSAVDSFTLGLEDRLELLAQLDRREGQTIEDLKRDPARAALLSVLYPGLGQLYIGNNLQRSLIIMGGGTAIIVGSIVGFGLLSGRPPEASSLGNLLIVGVLLGYHLWNIRDAYVQTDEHNKMIEEQSRLSWLDQIQLGVQRDTLMLSWSSSF